MSDEVKKYCESRKYCADCELAAECDLWDRICCTKRMKAEQEERKHEN